MQGALLDAARTTEVKLVLPFGVLTLASAVTSMAICFGEALLTVLGIELPIIKPHVQAVFMWGLALVALYGLWQDRRHHHSNIPLAIGAVGTAVLIATLYIRYFVEIEVFAYVLLVIAAFTNQTIFLGILNRTVQSQAHEIEALNKGLEAKIESQVQEIDRLGRLKQFLSPQVADLVITKGQEKLLDTHRRYVACLFCDIRDFTTVSEDIEPEEVIAVLQAYHEEVGRIVTQHHGTIGFRAGDGVMAFFNDPIPCAEPVLDAVRVALGIRAAFANLRAPWSRRGHAIGLGIGIASGYATLGLVGVLGRSDYTAIGGAVNIASRLCDKATDEQVLMTQRAYLDVERRIQAEPLGLFELKGVKSAVEVYSVVGCDEPTA